MFLLGWGGESAGALATGLLMVGTLFVAVSSGWFLLAKRGLPVRDPAPAERSWYSQEAAVLLAELAPLVLALRDREQALGLELPLMDVPRAREVHEAMERARTGELWSAFARASTLVEEDPKRAAEQLRWLRPRLQECVTSLGALLGTRLASGAQVERGEGHGGS